jgi:hypothetical protein
MWKIDTLVEGGIYLFHCKFSFSIKNLTCCFVYMVRFLKNCVSCCLVKMLFLWTRNSLIIILRFASVDLIIQRGRNGTVLNTNIINFRIALDCVLKSHLFLQHRDRIFCNKMIEQKNNFLQLCANEPALQDWLERNCGLSKNDLIWEP